MLILGIESSCDECAAAVVEDGRKVRSNVVASQVAVHAPYQGVVPELASRKHLQWIAGVVEAALEEAGCERNADGVWLGLDAVAASVEPGLIGSLLVGQNFGRALAWSWSCPFIPINHVQAHLYAIQLEEEVAFPFLGAVLSGGHSLIARCNNFSQMEILGATMDDALGEALDKVAKHYGLGFPGGPAMEKLARSGQAAAFAFPSPNLYKGEKREHRYDLSFSGLKTAAIHHLDRYATAEARRDSRGSWVEADISASFQEACMSFVTSRLVRAAEEFHLTRIVVGGGVAANICLREKVKRGGEKIAASVHFPSIKLCGDNAAMIAGLAYQQLKVASLGGTGSAPFSPVEPSFEVAVKAKVPGYRRLGRPHPNTLRSK